MSNLGDRSDQVDRAEEERGIPQKFLDPTELVRIVRVMQYIGERRHIETTLRMGAVPCNGEVRTPTLIIQSALMSPFPEIIDRKQFPRMAPPPRPDMYWHKLNMGDTTAIEVSRTELAVLIAALDYCALDPIRGTPPVLDLLEKLKQHRDRAFPKST